MKTIEKILKIWSLENTIEFDDLLYILNELYADNSEIDYHVIKSFIKTNNLDINISYFRQKLEDIGIDWVTEIGGYEGDDEYYLIVYQHQRSGRYFAHQGSYDSWVGIQFYGKWKEVKPVEKVVIEFEDVN